ncbi:MAG TPA: TatD family hydrolase [Gemmatimonadota bacterium]|nr:TatD family hydrolase [Gemmatimonadota bacterium]
MSGILYFDSHSHVQESAFEGDQEAVLERARAAGVAEIIAIGADPESANRARELAEQTRGLRMPRIWHTAGLHPHEASRWEAGVRRAIEANLAAGAVAVGEIGLDYHYDHSPREAQRRAFADQLAMAAERGLPAVVHSRDADDDTLAVLTESDLAPDRIVLHCFSGSRRMLEIAVERGYFVSFSGMVTFRSFPARGFVPEVPRDRLLAESDAPYLAPVPYRGRRNEPSYLVETVAALAGCLDLEPAAMADATRANARHFYGLDG